MFDIFQFRSLPDVSAGNCGHRARVSTSLVSSKKQSTCARLTIDASDTDALRRALLYVSLAWDSRGFLCHYYYYFIMMMIIVIINFILYYHYYDIFFPCSTPAGNDVSQPIKWIVYS